jgi:hypothetical protein
MFGGSAFLPFDMRTLVLPPPKEYRSTRKTLAVRNFRDDSYRQQTLQAWLILSGFHTIRRSILQIAARFAEHGRNPSFEIRYLLRWPRDPENIPVDFFRRRNCQASANLLED